MLEVVHRSDLQLLQGAGVIIAVMQSDLGLVVECLPDLLVDLLFLYFCFFRLPSKMDHFIFVGTIFVVLSRCLLKEISLTCLLLLFIINLL